MFLTVFPHFMPKNKSLPSLFAQLPVTLYKIATVSNSLRLLMTKERQEQFSLFHQQFTLSLTKNEQIAWKFMSQFPTLPEHSQLVFEYVVIACSLESTRPGLVQGCKAPNGVGSACLITSLESGLPQ